MRRDGSRFALLHIDADQHVLGVAFYRPSGALLSAVDSSYAVASQAPANVKCGSSSQAKIGTGFWKKTRKWWIGATPGGLNRDAVVKAVRNAQSEWTNDINWCGIKDQAAPPASYEGKTSNKADKQDGKSVVDWGSLSGQDCAGARVYLHLVRREGHPGRVGHQVLQRLQVVDVRRIGHARHPVIRGSRDRPRPPVRSRDQLGEGRRNERDVAVLRKG